MQMRRFYNKYNMRVNTKRRNIVLKNKYKSLNELILIIGIDKMLMYHKWYHIWAWAEKREFLIEKKLKCKKKK